MLLSEHTGTHVDAPAHTFNGGKHINEIPLKDLVGPAIVVDINEQGAKDRDYQVQVKDLLGTLPITIVLNMHVSSSFLIVLKSF